MIVTQQREPSKGTGTLSKVFIDGYYICDVVEDVVRETPGVPVADWKIKGVTAIPAGLYKIVLQTSNRFGPNTLTLLNVPGFEYLRIHGGNTDANTDGCLLPGSRNSEDTVAFSQIALKALHAIIDPTLKVGEEVLWEIKPALMEA